ncbi:Putative WW domain-binding protein [Colletotrichum destructivum]|uniref:WW domain-binding protein n=1 Tax=Colletotrichum destructivum TaxID=34406 RepID=A0AAX4IYC3_9PEZI|nr:Putative WW domain-binding protein [Colletotrichum destructivum]
MSEYWKSTPKYWCKHCSIFVRDTKLERQNHEATGKHQGALKRFLRDLHRGHEQEEREKERAKREVERLKGIAPGSSASAFSAPSFPRPGGSSGAPAPSSAEAQRKQQMEQLAGLGVSIPTAFRGDMAMAGEWTVTATKVVDPDAPREKPVVAKAVGVRKRERTDEEKEEEEAVRGLFKKRKGWGSTRRMPEDDGDLDALLSSNTLLRAVKKEEDAEEPAEADAKGDVKLEESPAEEEVKKEDGVEDVALADVKPDAPSVKREPEDDDDDAGKGLDVPALGDAAVKKEDEATAESAEAAAPAVVFKKRKPKNIRQK